MSEEYATKEYVHISDNRGCVGFVALFLLIMLLGFFINRADRRLQQQITNLTHRIEQLEGR